MTTPSVPRCGRMDPHEAHRWMRPEVYLAGLRIDAAAYDCPGAPIHEGGAHCQHCGCVVCTCDAELAEARRVEWES